METFLTFRYRLAQVPPGKWPLKRIERESVCVYREGDVMFLYVVAGTGGVKAHGARRQRAAPLAAVR